MTRDGGIRGWCLAASSLAAAPVSGLGLEPITGRCPIQSLPGRPRSGTCAGTPGVLGRCRVVRRSLSSTCSRQHVDTISPPAGER
jgi:hypothetical protein